MKKKIEKQFLYEGLGFPILLIDVPMMETRGTWTPDINYNELQKIVLISLAKKPLSLTGNEIKFIRKYFRKTLEAFGKEFGVSHAAIIEWEKTETHPVKMNPATEKCIRLYIFDALNIGDHNFRDAYHQVEIHQLAMFQKSKNSKLYSKPMAIDMHDLKLVA